MNEDGSVKLGEEMILNNEPHFVTELTPDGGALFKTFNEVYEESNCNGCKFLFKEKGWIFRERVKSGVRMPHTVGCKLGQFGMSHNPTKMPKKCNLKNYVYSERQNVKEHLLKAMENRPKDASILGESNFWGLDVFNLKEPSVKHIIQSDIRECVRS